MTVIKTSILRQTGRPGLTLKQTKHVRRASRPRGTTQSQKKQNVQEKKLYKTDVTVKKIDWS